MNFKILVADDEYYARKVLVMMLEKSGLPILVEGDFEDGEEVIEYLYNREINGKVYIDDDMKNKIDAYYEQYGAK